jgi:hypothetical protein
MRGSEERWMFVRVWHMSSSTRLLRHRPRLNGDPFLGHVNAVRSKDKIRCGMTSAPETWLDAMFRATGRQGASSEAGVETR